MCSELSEDITGMDAGKTSQAAIWKLKARKYLYYLAEYGTPLQYSCLENPTDGGAWWAAVHGVAEGRTRLSDFTFTFNFQMAAWLVLPASIPVISSESSEHMNDVFQCCYSVITFVTYTVLITLENSFASDYLPHLRCCPVWKQFWVSCFGRCILSSHLEI